jgi:hypothetical protein
MTISISLSASGTPATVRETLQRQRDAAIATQPAAQQLVDSAIAVADASLSDVDEFASCSVSGSLFLTVTKPA